MLQDRYKDIRATFNYKARDVIKTDGFRWFQTFKALKISDSEMRGNDRDPDGDDEREIYTPGEGLLYIE
jgi:hypothetical protein